MFTNFIVQASDAPISSLTSPATNFNNTGGTISNLLKAGQVDVVNLAFVGIGIVFAFNLVMAGWDYMLSSGDPKKAAIASTRLTNGLTGLAMAFTAFLVVKIISTILGIQTVF